MLKDLLNSAIIAVAKTVENAIPEIPNRTPNSSQRSRSQSSDPQWVITARGDISRFIEENAHRSVSEVEAEIHALVRRVVDKAYQAGGQEMFEGIKRNNPNVKWK